MLQPRKLHLGCGSKILEGFVNVDILDLPGVDERRDLNLTPWPWGNQTFDEIIAKDLVEHLKITLVEFMNECWRLLVPGGTVYVKTPDAADLDLSFADPTHRWHLRKHSFANYLSRQGVDRWHYTDLPWMWIELSSDGHYVTCHAQPLKGARGEALCV
jgi:predicted SAM-dependent methyltransferase